MTEQGAENPTQPNPKNPKTLYTNPFTNPVWSLSLEPQRLVLVLNLYPRYMPCAMHYAADAKSDVMGFWVPLLACPAYVSGQGSANEHYCCLPACARKVRRRV